MFNLQHNQNKVLQFLTNLFLAIVLLGAPSTWAAIAIDDFFVVNQDSTNNFFDVLPNDLAINPDPLGVGDFTLVDEPGNGQGTITFNGGFRFTPAPGFVGVVVFSYQINDLAGSSSADVVFAVVDNFQPFEAVDDLFFVPSGEPINITLPILANDVLPNPASTFIIDPSVSGVTPLGGSLSPGSTTIDYLAPIGIDGIDIIQYQIQDSMTGEIRQATIAIQLSTTTLGDPSGTIVFEGGQFSGQEGGTATITARRISGTSGPVMIEIDAKDDGAINGTDYDFTPNTVLVWADREGGTKSF